MGFYSAIRGLTVTLLRLGKQGPQLKDNGGAVDVRDKNDVAFANVRVLDPVIDDDAVNKRYFVANSSSGVPTYVASGAKFTVAASFQALYHEEIVNDGELIISGVLVKV